MSWFAKRFRRDLPLSQRVALVAAIVGLILALSLQVVGLTVARRQLEAAYQHHAASTAEQVLPQVEEALLTGMTYRLPPLIESLTHAHPYLRYVVIARHDGSVLAHSLAASPLPNDLLNFVKDHSVPLTQQSTYDVSTESGDVLHLVQPVEGGRVGYMHLGLSWGPVDSALRETCLNLLVAMVAGLLVSSVIAWFAYQRLVGPLAELARAARQFGEGKLQTRVAERPDAQDETETLGRAFNQMAGKLEHHVNELERSQADLIKAERALAHAEKLHVVGQLAAGVAHEINSPLDGAIEASRIMERSSTDPEKVVRFARAQRGALERIAAIVRTLLTFSRQPKTREHRPVSVARLLAEALAILKHRVTKKDIILELPNFNDNEPTISGDELGLVQVVVNLINNALDVTPEGKIVRVEVKTGPDQVVIAVIDQGLGIPADIAPRLFTPFFTTKDVGQGTGLGLATSRNIAEEHGGRIEFSNLQAPWGARFSIHLPRRQRPVAGAREESLTTSQSQV